MKPPAGGTGDGEPPGRKPTYEELLERVARLEGLEQLASFPARNPNPVAEADLGGRLRYVNPAAESLFPDLREKGPAHPWLAGWETVVSAIRGSDGQVLSRVVAVGARHYQQTLHFLAELESIRIYSVDVTDRVKVNQALRESEERFAAIHDNAPFAIALTRMPDGTIVSVNDAFLRLFELDRPEVVGRTSLDLGLDDAGARAMVGADPQGRGSVRDFECTRTTRSGARHVLLLNLDWVVVGEERLLLTTIQDITDRRRAEDALRESERLYRAIGESIDYGVWVCAPDGRNVYASESFLRLVGITQQQCSDFGWGDVLHPDDTERTIAAWKECVRTGGAWSIEHRFRGVDGQWHPVLARGVPVKDDQGKVLCWAGINLDISEQKRAEEALLEADRRKNEFLAVLSHELRNPLAPIRNSLSVLDRATPGSEPARRAREVVGRQTGHLARLVDDLLDITRVSRNKIQLRRAPLELTDLVRRTVDDYHSLFDGKRILLETGFATERLPIRGDGARLAQVVGNLLQNAAKFTPPGGRVTVATAVARSRRRATLRVADTGAGMEPAMLPRLFQPFMQADATLDRSKGGLGLGLALVKGLVEMHGGEVCAHSPGPGRGAEFVVELPLEENAAAESIQGGARPPASGRRVLIVEDNIDAADSLREVLQFGAHAVEVAYSGPEGLALAREFKPEVVLCDIGLPGMDGFQVARAFRADEGLKGTYLVALTGYALSEDLRRAREAGFDLHIAKPPSLESLEELLATAPRG